MLLKLFTYLGPIFVILSVLCGLGYNHYTNKIKEINDQLQKNALLINTNTEIVLGFKIRVKWFMYLGPIFVILSVLCGAGYNHCTNEIKEINEQSQKNILPVNTSKGAVLDFSTEGIGIVRIKWEKQSFDGELGLFLYGLAIVNSSKESLTIKDASLEFEVGEKKYSERPLNLITGIVWDKQKNTRIPSLMMKTKETDTLFALDWVNINDRISKGMLLQPGEILQGSAFYLLHMSNPFELNNIKKLSIVITDYLGNKTKNPLSFSETPMIIPEMIQVNFEKIAK